MKIARTLIQPFRLLTAGPATGIKPSLLRQIKDANRRRSHFTRVRPIKPYSDIWPFFDSQPPRQRRQMTPESFEKIYERFDHLVPLDANHSKFLSDLVEPSLFREKDFDAQLELEEAQRPLYEGVCKSQLAGDGAVEMADDDVVMADVEEVDDVEMTDVLYPPQWVYWQGKYPPPEFFFPFIPPPAGADVLQQATEVATEPVATPSPLIPEPRWKDELAEYFENLEYNITNGILPPKINVEAMYPADSPASTPRDEEVGVETAQPEKNEVPEEDCKKKASPQDKTEPVAATEPVSAESAVEKKTMSLGHVPDQYRGLLEEAVNFSADQQKPWPDWWNTIALGDNEGEEGKGKCVVRSFEQYAAWPPSFKVQPQFHCPDSSNPTGEFNTPASCRLGLKRNTEERKRFSEIRKNHPEVWEAIIGTMLQEGVSIDSMLLCHEKKDEGGNTVDLRPQVLDHQQWCVDNWRFDGLSWHTVQGAPLAPDCSAEFHKAPKGDERLFQETIGYIKSHPEICYAFRILVSEWLKVEANQATFRWIARKAGWCPVAEHQLQRDFIKWVFADADATPREIFEVVEKHFPDRYPRFFAATIEEEGIDYL
ncbi:hypothetical protein AYL99_09162 [Fonsecaea erecta]|uniref:Uncharacterized protein n=1 Tax=Fonsecaea erecta TaxID=1367422 RepID=A0A178ZB92_9EURO|nr:hypothetical protein AYL99_09162 [Fonsecaea erecta]OAP57049.1 hypothetical protein AYL99_09162 [Fonsecaea erecta]